MTCRRKTKSWAKWWTMRCSIKLSNFSRELWTLSRGIRMQLNKLEHTYAMVVPKMHNELSPLALNNSWAIKSLRADKTRPYRRYKDTKQMMKLNNSQQWRITWWIHQILAHWTIITILIPSKRMIALRSSTSKRRYVHHRRIKDRTMCTYSKTIPHEMIPRANQTCMVFHQRAKIISLISCRQVQNLHTLLLKPPNNHPQPHLCQEKASHQDSCINLWNLQLKNSEVLKTKEDWKLFSTNSNQHLVANIKETGMKHNVTHSLVHRFKIMQHRCRQLEHLLKYNNNKTDQPQNHCIDNWLIKACRI